MFRNRWCEIVKVLPASNKFTDFPSFEVSFRLQAEIPLHTAVKRYSIHVGNWYNELL